MDPYIRGEQKKRERNKDNTGPDMKDIVTDTTEVKKEEVPKWRRDLKKLDGQGEDGQGKGGRLAGAAKAISQFQGMREQAKWKGDSNPDPVRGGESQNTVPGEEISDYDKWIATEKKKKKNKNYD